MTKTLDDIGRRGQLSHSNEFELVKVHLDYLSGGKACGQSFSRTDEEYRPIYELIRSGRMPESETMLGKLLNNVLGEGKEGVLRSQRIDGKNLPEYDAVRRYFGPAGMTADSEDEGWFLTGFILSKETPAALAEAPAAGQTSSTATPAAGGETASSEPAAVEVATPVDETSETIQK